MRVRASTLLDSPATSTDPLFLQRTDGDMAEGQLFFDRINLFAFNDQLGTAGIDAAAVQRAGAAQQSVGAPQETSDYLHVRDLPSP